MRLMDFPFVVVVLSFLFLFVAAEIGDQLRKKMLRLKEEEQRDFGVVLGATLTRLGLQIGFSFSMAVSRSDQRKSYEEAEANAISTEYARADLLPASDASRVRGLLRKYVDQRMLFYTTRNPQRIAKINADTAELQSEMRSAVRAVAAAQLTAVVALAVSGMNEVASSQGNTQAAWWNQIPTAAWVLMLVIAICSNFLIGGMHVRQIGAYF